MIHRFIHTSKPSIFTILLFLLFLVTTSYSAPRSSDAAPPADTNTRLDRDYRLQAFITGYVGMGGDIDGIRNPVLRAKKGERVRITIINGEIMTHDIAMEKAGVKSNTIINKGASASITFVAKENDTYYCSIPGHRLAGMEGQFKIIEESTGQVVAEGVIPEKDGQPLNLGFESGTLRGWTPTGEAFDGQSVVGAASPLYGEEMNARPRGAYFVSSGGTKGYKATGTLTSAVFEVTHPWAAFRVSGGVLQDTRVELVLADGDSVFFQITGNDHERLRPVVVDLRPHQGKQIYIRLIDRETGVSPITYIWDNIWAHVSFDDFRFYSARPEFPDELRPEDIITLPPLDFIAHAGIPGEQAVRVMEVPEGFSVTLAAAEPDVINPIAMALDHRGRLWVAEGHTYPVKAPEGEGKDRILIFEDTDGNGTLDHRTVFIEGLNLVSGLEIGFGGVWVGAAPELLFIPINEEGNAPAGEPQVLLDGWGYHDTHETLNSFRWGPDGWLYGLQGVFTHSSVGKPGTPDEQRAKFNAAVWRYHPTRHEFEVFARGTSNPWGIAFNDYGHAFVTACVIPHLFHITQGGRYRRQAGEPHNPYTYANIKTIADHVHWAGGNGPHAGNARSGAVGGGHAHAGAMFYLGSEDWPAKYRSSIFMNNIHGARVNIDHIKRQGSGYSGTHGQDFLLTNDAWSQWLDFQYGPGGSVWAIDWYDEVQCHSADPTIEDKTHGRIFKISYKTDQWIQVDLTERSSLELVELQLHPSDWYVRHARRILQARGPDPKVHRALKKILRDNPDITRKLNALWVLHVTQGLTEADMLGLLGHESAYIRGWTVQLMTEDKEIPDVALQRFAQIAYNDPSALVRLQLAAALQRIEPARRWDILAGLLSHGEDAGDQNLPQMIWYAAEPMAEVNLDRALNLAFEAELPHILDYTVRRIAALDTPKARRALQEANRRLQARADAEQHHEAQMMIDQLLGKIE